MVEPISMLMMLLLGLGGAAAIAIAYLTMSNVMSYLREKKAQKRIQEDAVIMKRKLQSGNFRVVAGFWDGDDIKDAQAWEAEDVDHDIKDFKDDEIVKLT